MDQTFKGNEIVKFAVEIEKNGKVFYEAVAANAENNNIKDVFSWLAEEEDRHRETFEKILSSMDQHQQPESYSGEYYDYMKALVDENVFIKGTALPGIIEKAATADESLQLALKFEKDSILFFMEMKRYVPESAHEAVDKLIGEEKKHVRKIMLLKNIAK